MQIKKNIVYYFYFGHFFIILTKKSKTMEMFMYGLGVGIMVGGLFVTFTDQKKLNDENSQKDS